MIPYSIPSQNPYPRPLQSPLGMTRWWGQDVGIFQGAVTQPTTAMAAGRAGAHLPSTALAQGLPCGTCRVAK